MEIGSESKERGRSKKQPANPVGVVVKNREGKKDWFRKKKGGKGGITTKALSEYWEMNRH